MSPSSSWLLLAGMALALVSLPSLTAMLLPARERPRQQRRRR